MAIPTIYKVVHSCKHTQTHDLSNKPAGKRKGLASWLSGQVCTDCFRKEGAEEYKKQLLQEALDNQQKLDLPPLEGTEKQVPWATTTRNTLLMTAYEEFVRGEDSALTDEEFDQQFLEPARLITGARWWIDYRDTEAADLKECLDTAIDTAEINENPF